VPTADQPLPLATRLGRWAYGRLFIGSLESLLRGARHVSSFRPERQGLTVERDVAYLPGGNPSHRLDIYHPPASFTGPRPVALYVHGGGFRYFDKTTHWAMAVALALHGFVVYTVDYRLAPMHRYPAAFEDVAAAAAFMMDHARAAGHDLDHMVWAGESAGGNLTTGLTIASCFSDHSALETTDTGRRLAAAARAVMAKGPPPKVLLPACGYLEVSRPERHALARPIPGWMNGRIHEVSRQYLPGHAEPLAEHRFANPLVFLETAAKPDRPWPATFAIVGDKDPVLGDSLRLPDAVRRFGVPAEARVYPGGIHAFHAMWFRALAKAAWTDQLSFVDSHLGQRPESGGPA
jgi:acetyl esterase